MVLASNRNRRDIPSDRNKEFKYTINPNKNHDIVSNLFGRHSGVGSHRDQRLYTPSIISIQSSIGRTNPNCPNHTITILYYDDSILVRMIKSR